MTILNPTVTKLQRLKIPRAVSVLIVYILVFSLLSVAIALMIPPLIEQTANFALSLPSYLNELKIPSNMADQVVRELTSELGGVPSQILKISVSIFSNILAVFAVLIFALYLLLAREKLDEQLSSFFKDDHAKKIERVFDKLEQKLGGWARGQIILMFAVGLATYIGLLIIGVPFAVPLALLAGILEIIPNLGPVIGAIPAVIVGFSISPLTGFATLALGTLIQQLENYLFVPKVMQKSAGVSPIITLLSLVIGFKVAGVVGALLSVPVVITIGVLMNGFVHIKDY
jgi:predicted PurR-regulated permease PerM